MADFVEKASEKITKLSDEQLERLLNTVREENKIYDSIIQSIPSGLVIVDNNWCITKINKSAKRYLHFFHLHLIKSEPVWNLIADEEVSNFISFCAQKQNTNTSEEFSIVSADDKARFIVVSILPLVRDGKIAGTIIFIEDITAKRQQEILMHRMESLKSLTNLAASVAHEIKNPLGAISIHIQLLQKSIKKCREGDGQLPDEKFMEKYLSVVNEEIENLNKIVMDFLFAVRPLKVNMTLSEPDSIIEKSINFFMPEFENCGIEVSVNLQGNGNRLLIDEKLFREIFINIVQNAKAAILSSKKNNGKLAINSFIKNDHYILTIADNGCGMDEATCSRIFEPYYTTKADGTGLGLTTVYKIVKEFRGEITVNSELDEGTVFTVQIPVPQKETMLLEE
ncbi:ATP-binding protein [uncultured Treponema sp.]|uniref:two-component system sensor histidine kinase NtrB n=1 Tax=uncultured Treponema sp. TaxID=162155 RepID=UPI0025888732|nr:ATP-binding protein [uncultured Treponema sp.]